MCILCLELYLYSGICTGTGPMPAFLVVSELVKYVYARCKNVQGQSEAACKQAGATKSFEIS